MNTIIKHLKHMQSKTKRKTIIILDNNNKAVTENTDFLKTWIDYSEKDLYNFTQEITS